MPKMITYYDEVKFEDIPFYSTKAIALKKVVNNSQEKDFIWNILHKEFISYMDDFQDDILTLAGSALQNAYPVTQIDTFMAYKGQKCVEDNGYALIDGRFVYREE